MQHMAGHQQMDSGDKKKQGTMVSLRKHNSSGLDPVSTDTKCKTMILRKLNEIQKIANRLKK